MFKAEEDMEDEHGDVAAQLPQPQYPWEGTDWDYSYEEVISCFTFMLSQNLEFRLIYE